ncbi:MAG TPA: ABC transporter permease [Mycobacteriales bacterium]|nr:ABC transporter permease [Mycobacteriales bacterium]
MTATDLGGRTPFIDTYRAVYAGQLARAKAARAPLLIVASIQSVGLIVLLRGIVSGGPGAEQQQLVAGATVLVVAFVALNLLAQRVGYLKASGALDYYAALPVPPAAVVLAMAAAYASFAVPGTLVTALVGVLLYDLSFAHFWVVAPAVALAGAALAGLGAALGLALPRPELATVSGQLGMTLVLFLGMVRGARMPDALRLVRAAVPSSYAADALAIALGPDPDLGAVARQLAGCAVLAVAALALATAAWRRGLHR